MFSGKDAALIAAVTSVICHWILGSHATSLSNFMSSFVNTASPENACPEGMCPDTICNNMQAGVNCGSQCKCENCQNQPADGPPESRPSHTRIRIESARQGVARIVFTDTRIISSGLVCPDRLLRS